MDPRRLYDRGLGENAKKTEVKNLFKITDLNVEQIKYPEAVFRSWSS